jgi:hypothetical protein
MTSGQTGVPTTAETLDSAMIVEERKNGRWTQPVTIVIQPPEQLLLPPQVATERKAEYIEWHGNERDTTSLVPLESGANDLALRLFIRKV